MHTMLLQVELAMELLSLTPISDNYVGKDMNSEEFDTHCDRKYSHYNETSW